MIHNYYLYEEDGFLSMIPWDYNLAYGTFQSGDASGAVNDPIDNPLSITEGDTDRPMFSWIISSEKYTRLYHEYYEKFLEQFYESGYLTDLIDSTYSMIHSYVEKDPTKFCEVSEFEKAVETMKEFVSLRFESVEGQLSGTIGSTDAAQSADSDTLIDASSITLSDMGSMGGGGSPGGGSGFPGFPGGGSGFSGGDSGFSGVDSGFPGGDSGFPGGPGGNDTGFPGGGTDGNDSGFPKGGNSTSPTLTAESEASDTKRNMPSDMNFPEFADESSNDTTRDSLPGDMNFPGFPGVSSDNDTQSNFPGSMNFDSFPQDAQSSFSLTSLLYLGGYILALIAAIIFAKLYKNRQ